MEEIKVLDFFYKGHYGFMEEGSIVLWNGKKSHFNDLTEDLKSHIISRLNEIS